MVHVVRATTGHVVPITFTIREKRTDSLNGTRSRVNGARVTVLNPDGTTLISAGVPVYSRRGEFIYYLDATSLAVGDYLVKGVFGMGYNSVSGTTANKIPHTFIVRLVNPL